MTAFPLARFQQAGTSPSVIAQLQTAWALLSPAVQDAEALYIESVSNYQLASITSLPASGGAVSAPSGIGVIYVSPSNTAQLGSDGTVGGPGGSPLVPAAVNGGSGTHAARPSASPANQLYYETDTGLMYLSDGTNWNLVKPGAELGYAETALQGQVTRAGSDISADVAGLNITVTVGVRPIEVRAGGPYLQHSAVGGATKASLVRTDTGAAVTASQFYCGASGPANAAAPWACKKRISLAAGSYTFKIVLWCKFINGTSILGADDGSTSTSLGPAWIQAVEV